MKYGVIVHNSTKNFGDDVQSYAAARLLPRVDYFLDREHLDGFQTRQGEPVAVFMNGWWLWNKWNWPPADCIIPLMISIHINNDTIYHGASPVLDRWTEGLGGDYLRAYGPIGVRDQFSLEFFRERGFDAYFSGCLTLTLPAQKRTEDTGTYICLVDVSSRVKDKIRRMTEGSGVRLVEMSHKCDFSASDVNMETRFQHVEEYLTIYQNARCVVTRRLHVSLPCLAMGTPVLGIVDVEERGNVNRWKPFDQWIHHTTEKDFLDERYSYNILNPPENDVGYRSVRETLIRQTQEFICMVSDDSRSAETWKKTYYTKLDVMQWQNSLMKETLEIWMGQSRELLRKYNQSEKKKRRLEKKLANEPGKCEGSSLTQRLENTESTVLPEEPEGKQGVEKSLSGKIWEKLIGKRGK